MKVKNRLIIALGFCSISLAVADNSLRISTDTTGASTTISDKEFLEIKVATRDPFSVLAITPGTTGNDLDLYQVNPQSTKNLFTDRPAYSISRPFLSGQTIRFAFQDELRTRIGEFNDTAGFTEKLVNDTASFCDVVVDVNPNTGEVALLRSDCTNGFTLDLEMSSNWVDWTPVDLSSGIGSLVARTIANGAPKPGVSWVNNQVAFTFVAQQDTAMSRIYGGRVNPQSGGVTVYPLNTIVNNAPSTANGTESTQTTMGDYVCFQYVDQMIAKVTVWDPASGDFQVHKLGYVAPGLKESASAAANLGFGRTAFAVDGQFFGTQASGSFSDDTFEVSNIGSFPIRGFDSGPVDFSLDQDLTGVLVGNVNGSGSFAETNQGNTKVFSRVLQNRSKFDVCNLENEDQHFRTNFIDSAGDLQFNDFFTLGGNECQEYSELNDASAQIGVGYSIFQGSGAVSYTHLRAHET